jgi:NAD-dependent SIR2 family protein deacetylase
MSGLRSPLKLVSVPDPVESISHFLAANERLVVLTGAGISTASGIPDYRDRHGNWKGADPVQFRDFMGDAIARRRYWTRSYAAWGRFSSAEPNDAHFAVASMESFGWVDTLVTQNVDGLHSRAGSRSVIDLHGALSRVLCMKCGALCSRGRHQERLRAANSDWHAEVTGLKPDGDVDLADRAGPRFVVPDCGACGGVLKPDVVMFGENVPSQRVREAMTAIERANALLVVGSSLSVFSGFRFARQAHALGKPIAIVNLGPTRADSLASLKVEVDCAAALPRAVVAGAGARAALRR